MTAAEIARTLHGRRSADGWLCRCPVPGHGKGRGDITPSLLVTDGDKVPLFKCFGGCEARDVLAELRRRGLDAGGPSGNSAAWRRDNGTFPLVVEPDHEPNPEALDIWRAGKPITLTKAASYLLARGITIAPPPSLRAGNDLHLDRFSLPCMVAAVQAPDRRVIAVQRTLIDPRGDRKAQVRLPRKTIGELGWGAVRLAAATDVLGIAEGVEKALAAMQLFGIPCWASLGAVRMHRVWIPDTVRTLHIFADNDEAGQAGSERTAHANRHRRIVLHVPPERFKDWDDVTRDQMGVAA